LAEKLLNEAQQVISDDDVPWSPSDVISAFVDAITKRRKELSVTWIDSIEAAASEVGSLSAADANRLYARAGSVPPILTEGHAKRLEKVSKTIEGRLDSLKIEWLVEKFKELSPVLRKKFVQMIDEM
jgi:hypothetical protein